MQEQKNQSFLRRTVTKLDDILMAPANKLVEMAANRFNVSRAGLSSGLLNASFLAISTTVTSYLDIAPEVPIIMGGVVGCRLSHDFYRIQSEQLNQGPSKSRGCLKIISYSGLIHFLPAAILALYYVKTHDLSTYVSALESFGFGSALYLQGAKPLPVQVKEKPEKPGKPGEDEECFW